MCDHIIINTFNNAVCIGIEKIYDKFKFIYHDLMFYKPQKPGCFNIETVPVYLKWSKVGIIYLFIGVFFRGFCEFF